VFDVLGRFLHMGIDAYSFAASLNGIVAQRLMRMSCSSCVRPHRPTEQELADAQLCEAEMAAWSLRAGGGCEHCRGTGYKGRKAIAEVLVLDDVLRELIAGQAPVSALKERAAQNGMRSLRARALALVASGETTLQEFLRVAG
jgi:general secretion pathway protein E